MEKLSGSEFGDIKILMPLKIADARQQNKNRSIALQENDGMGYSK